MARLSGAAPPERGQDALPASADFTNSHRRGSPFLEGRPMPVLFRQLGMKSASMISIMNIIISSAVAGLSAGKGPDGGVRRSFFGTTCADISHWPSRGAAEWDGGGLWNGDCGRQVVGLRRPLTRAEAERIPRIAEAGDAIGESPQIVGRCGSSSPISAASCCEVGRCCSASEKTFGVSR